MLAQRVRELDRQTLPAFFPYSPAISAGNVSSSDPLARAFVSIDGTFDRTLGHVVAAIRAVAVGLTLLR